MVPRLVALFHLGAAAARPPALVGGRRWRWPRWPSCRGEGRGGGRAGLRAAVRTAALTAGLQLASCRKQGLKKLKW